MIVVLPLQLLLVCGRDGLVSCVDIDGVGGVDDADGVVVEAGDVVVVASIHINNSEANAINSIATNRISHTTNDSNINKNNKYKKKHTTKKIHTHTHTYTQQHQQQQQQ